MYGVKRRNLVNPVHEYIAQQRRAFEETFPALYDHSDKCINDEIAAFLTSSLTGLLDIIEHEIDALFETEQSIVHLDVLAQMFHDVRHATGRCPVAGSGPVTLTRP